ncbi:ComEC/Rec2 family competence protein [Alicyclobacillus fastidiosus]|uniref:ComEC/Rec2 family competence protein n=1 Tax=Alicyclobacillus fastidiosus TaxID=392011 RepID=A0ABV5ACR4_9BACL|nr:ComEC/Rec2 family competence protein [Alicyclobacillus fastidiosus]WEH11320.1 ComEC/Rec2 family competence protein [Alicyclobacillus fastidiosus]
MNTCAWLGIGALVVAQHMSVLPHPRYLELALLLACSGLGCALVAILRWPATQLCVACMTAVSTGLALGLLHRAWIAPSPTAVLGAQTLVQGTVEHIAMYGQQTILTISVDADGSDANRRCRYTASWSSFTRAPSAVVPGERVLIRGVFVSKPAGEPLQEWLAPTYALRGQLLRTEPAQGLANGSNELEQALVRTVPEADRTLTDVALSMVVGRAAPLSPATEALFLDAGVTHLLAASGANVVLCLRFARLVWQWGFRWWGVRSRILQTAYELSVIWGFVCLCGCATPIARAGVFASYTVLSRACGRPVGAFTGLSVSSLLFALWSPQDVSSVSGVLSVTAAFAMCQTSTNHTAHPWQVNKSARQASSLRVWGVAKLQSGLLHVLELTYTSVLMDVYMIPLVWWWFGQLTPYGALATVVVEPVLVVLLPLTILWCCACLAELAAPCSQLIALSHLLGLVAVALVNGLCHLLQQIVQLPYSFDVMPALPFWFISSYYGFILFLQRYQPFAQFISRMFARQLV